MVVVVVSGMDGAQVWTRETAPTQPLYYWLVVSVWTGFALNFFVARAGALAREVWSAAA
jgi:hypothetical protein